MDINIKNSTFKMVYIVFVIAVLIIIVLNGIVFREYNTVEECGEVIEEEFKQITVILDPGHGGVDPGAVGKYKDNEDVINLRIAKKLAAFLEGSGINVLLTRYDENGLYTEKSTTYRSRHNEDLKKRVEIINDSGADLCISIHLNSFTQQKYYGAQTFYKKNCEISKDTAKIIQSELKYIVDENNNRVSMVKNDIMLVKEVNTPFVLVECGFMSNPAEERLLNTDLFQEKLAWAIFSGILKHFEKQQ